MDEGRLDEGDPGGALLLVDAQPGHRRRGPRRAGAVRGAARRGSAAHLLGPPLGPDPAHAMRIFGESVLPSLRAAVAP
ncbi:hypothetical protein [Streptosporangium vulgare]|uniref:hypothetical protein n=1 Tax=Streptosporangium vulgare TaxID=46190 RepID=UPI0031D1DBF4